MKLQGKYQNCDLQKPKIATCSSPLEFAKEIGELEEILSEKQRATATRNFWKLQVAMRAVWAVHMRDFQVLGSYFFPYLLDSLKRRPLSYK